jgi:uncharacterized repeat protein (TIGR02543 family)
MKKARVFLIAVVAALTMGFTACESPVDETGGGDPTDYTVTFKANYDGEEAPADVSITVEPDAVIPADQIPAWTRASYTFDGWYANAEGEGEAVSLTAAVDSDLVLYAKWTIVTYTVTFRANYTNGPANVLITVDSGSVVPSAEIPVWTRDGFVLDGWYENAAGTGNAVSLTGPVTKNLSLYAKWNSTYAYGSAVVSGNTIVHENPLITALGGAVLNGADGSVTMRSSSDSLSYGFPQGLSLDWKECTTIKIEFTLEFDEGNRATLNVRDGTSASGSAVTYNPTPGLHNSGNNPLNYSVTNYPNSVAGSVTPGFTWIYSDTTDADTTNNGSVFTVKITRITFTKLETVADYSVDLTGRTDTRNPTALNNNGIYQFPLGLPSDFPIASYTKITVKGTFYQADGTTVISPTYGAANVLLLANSGGSTSGSNVLATLNNLGSGAITTSAVAFPSLTTIPGALAFQVLNNTIKFIEITEITFKQN